jgi:hypothetical protein
MTRPASIPDAEYDDEELSDEEIAAIQESEADIRAGRVRSLLVIMKDLSNNGTIRSSSDK